MTPQMENARRRVGF